MVKNESYKQMFQLSVKRTKNNEKLERNIVEFKECI